MRPAVSGGLFAALVATSMAVASPAAAAVPVTYNFNATVLVSHGGPPRKVTLPVSITLDRAFPADPNTANPARLATYTGGSASPSGISPILAVTLAGQDVHGWFDSVRVQRNLNGLSEIALQTALPQYGTTLQIAFTTTIRGVVTSVAIPKAIVPGNFQTAAFSVYVAPTDQFSGSLK